jgi:hypothetical protein
MFAVPAQVMAHGTGDCYLVAPAQQQQQQQQQQEQQKQENMLVCDSRFTSASSVAAQQLP